MKCKFDEAWIGKCGAEADESGFCEKHKGITCVSCGEPATHTCSETMGLVCGAPLCDLCTHTTCGNGCNSGAPLPEGHKPHCRKSEQKYAPWYVDKINLSIWKKENGISEDAEVILTNIL